MNNLQDLQLLQLKFHVTTAERHVIKLVNQTLKSAFKNSIMANSTILTRKLLEKNVSPSTNSFCHES